MAESLRVLDLPGMALAGLHLIEASAGTGKTYAISHLVLRLVLEAERRIDQILVLTFTDAATEELRERITQRLREARAAFVPGSPAPRDALLADLVARHADPERARVLLDAAVAAMDRAAIHTIHGFCYSLLRDFAFECGVPFDAELLSDEGRLRREVAEDFWRRRLAGLERDEAHWILTCLPKGPDSLIDRLAVGLGAVPLRLLPEEAPEWRADWEAARALFGRLRALWPEARKEVAALLRGAALRRNIYSESAIEASLVTLDELVASALLPVTLDNAKDFERLTPAKLALSTLKAAKTPKHAVFDLCGELAASLENLGRRFCTALYHEALAFMRAELARRKAERRLFAFDDLLGLVDEALAGARGAALAARIRETYRHVLIDEFQDTDSLQYRIFSRVYIENQGHEQERLGLFLIGDPKQAIYAFRGADIFTYMGAGRVAARRGCVHGMDTNWRSTTPLIAAVNQIFSSAQAPFIFAEDIRFEPVKPRPDADAEPLRLEGAPATGLLWRWLPITDANRTDKGERIRADLARHEAAADCASEIAALLVAAGEGRARLGSRELRAGDIAVLVRSHREGRLIREALARHGISCVSIGRETVFTSEEAEELAIILAALRAGADEGALRRALATRLLGWSAADLAGLESDEGRWSALLARFEDYRERWRTGGPLSALERLVHQEGVAVRLRAEPDGERRLTNLLHLIELAQEAERQHPGIEGLEQWLADQRREADSGDGALLRLESDEALVRILTIHKSKGLEFPLVFLPFVYGANPTLARPPAVGEPFIFHDRERLERCLDLGTDEPSRCQHLTLLREEALAEDLRLFYVAITRAKQRCVIYWGAVNHLERSALAYLLHQDVQGGVAHLARTSEEDLRADLVRLVAASDGAMRLENIASARVQGAPSAAVERQTLAPASFRGLVRRDWRILSYSGLAAGRTDGEHPDHDAFGPAAPVSGRHSDPVDPIFDFPRGARAGECLHHLFEHLDFPEARGAALEAAVDGVLARHGLEAEWRTTLIDWTGQVLDTPLDAQGLCLRQLTLGQRRNELEFDFALEGFEPHRLSRLLECHGYPMPRLDAGRWRGLMKGFIDLVFRLGDRYYILDYKSNHLGDRLDDYGPEGLQQAMRAHHYHLQYLIYLVALHRYLGWRLPGYEVERHIGGVYYLFLRGMRPEHGPGRGVFYDRPPCTLIESLDACFGAALEKQP